MEEALVVEVLPGEDREATTSEAGISAPGLDRTDSEASTIQALIFTPLAAPATDRLQVAPERVLILRGRSLPVHNL